jgi:hypothetical protein
MSPLRPSFRSSTDRPWPVPRDGGGVVRQVLHQQSCRLLSSAPISEVDSAAARPRPERSASRCCERPHYCCCCCCPLRIHLTSSPFCSGRSARARRYAFKSLYDSVSRRARSPYGDAEAGSELGGRKVERSTRNVSASTRLSRQSRVQAAGRTGAFCDVRLLWILVRRPGGDAARRARVSRVGRACPTGERRDGRWL